jgi:hypothetical protein
MKAVLGFAIILSALLAGCAGESPPPPTPTPTPQLEASRPASIAAGGTVSLADGTSLTVPAGALTQDITVGLSRGGDSPPAEPHLARLAEPVHVDLQGQTLSAPATLEIPYDPSLLPPEMTENEIFASFYSADFGVWVPVGGTADPVRQVLVVETTHASWWEIDTWLTDALLQGLVAGFKFDLGHVLDAGAAFYGCSDTTNGIIIDEGENFDYTGSCLEVDDATKPRIRIVNRRVARVRINVRPGPVSTNFQPEVLALGPLETSSFDADFTNAPKTDPLIVTADIDLGETVGMALVDFLLVLPGAKDAIDKDVQARIIAILYENRSFVAAITALSSGDVSGFVSNLTSALGDATTRDRIASTVLAAAPKGSLLSKLGPILRSNLWVIFAGAGLAIQVADGVIQMQFGQGNVKFYSNRPSTPPCPIADSSLCDLALEVQRDIESGNASITTHFITRHCVIDGRFCQETPCVDVGLLGSEGACIAATRVVSDMFETHQADGLHLFGIAYPSNNVLSGREGPILFFGSHTLEGSGKMLVLERVDGDWRINSVVNMFPFSLWLYFGPLDLMPFPDSTPAHPKWRDYTPFRSAPG